MKSDKAIEKIEKAGLYATTVGNIESEYVEAGKILLQSPSGELFALEGSEIQLTVSSGKGGVVGPEDDMLTMPYIIWDNLEEAKEKLAEAGFESIAIAEEYSDAVSAGQVISTSIKDGERVKKGTEVTLVISMGVDPAKAEARSESQATSNNSSTHDHSWVDITETIHHDAVTREEQVPIDGRTYVIVHYYCAICGRNVDSPKYGPLDDDTAYNMQWDYDLEQTFEETHKSQYHSDDETYGWNSSDFSSSGSNFYYDYETEIVEVEPAWDETIVTGQKCSTCGAMR